MEELLLTLGHKVNLCHRVWLVSLFVGATMGFVVFAHVLHALLLLNPLAILVGSWLIWFTWQSWLFPSNRVRYLRSQSNNPYRKAFYRDILPGISFGISQMIVPLSYGFLVTAPFPLFNWTKVFGLVCITVGVTLLCLGFKAIGIAGAGFLFEYRDNPPPLTSGSVYAYIRHPLFLGGVIASSGACLLSSNDTWTLALAALNVAILPVYGHIEDVRLSRVFGEQYLKYRVSVGRFMPKLSVLLKMLTIY